MTKRVFDIFINHIFPIRYNFLNHEFDYPNYGGLPKSIYETFSPEAVDAMQSILHNPRIKISRKRDFAKAYKERLNELGEEVKVTKIK